MSGPGRIPIESKSLNSQSDKTPESPHDRSPHRVLTLFDCVCIIVGTIIGAGIFKMPAIVAAQVPNVFWLVGVWVFGGIIALIGALCFAELTTTYPDRGGDYGYLKRAYHRRIGFAFSWAAFWVIRPTSIALMAMIFGEFATEVVPNSWPLYGFAILCVVGLSVTNLIGVRIGKTAQNVLTVAKVIGILVVVVAAFAFWQPINSTSNPDISGAATSEDIDGGTTIPVPITGAAGNDASSTPGNEPSGQISSESESVKPESESTWEWFWLSMVFVMFTFGGWNDIAFVASETREPKKNLLRSLVIGTGVVLLVYLMVNLALVFGLGFTRMASLGGQWENATSVLVEQNMGSLGNYLLSILVCISCLGAVNAMIFTSPRIYWATAADYPGLRWISGSFDGRGWWRAMLLQAFVTIAYIWTFGNDKNGVENLTAANAPYFWSFLGLTVISLIVNRFKFKGEFVGYRVPLYPILPLVFTGACLFMVYRSWTYMIDQELWVPTFVIGLWVGFGFVLSFVLQSKHDS